MTRALFRLSTNFRKMVYRLEKWFRFVTPYLFSFRYKAKEGGQSILENFLERKPHLSIEDFRRDILEGRVMCNGKPIGPDYQVQEGDELLRLAHWHEPEVLSLPIDILHVSDEMVVVNKPPSIPVHPGGDYRKNTMEMILASTHRSLLEAGKYLYVVHRLDRLASGLLILARTSKASAVFHSQFRRRTVMKEYLARVKGVFPEGRVEVCESIARKQTYPIKFGVCPSSEGKPALTVFERESVSPDGTESVVRCIPRTGRTHQIRVHLASLGYPIINDGKYGGNLELSMAPEPPFTFSDYPQFSWCPICRAQGHRQTDHIAPEDLLSYHICLHAIRYWSTDPHFPWEFTAPRPAWSHFEEKIRTGLVDFS